MFITFEGIEGAGKSTILNMLAEHFCRLGHTPLITREPGGCRLGRSMRSILLDERSAPIAPNAELCLFLADRAQHLQEVIIPALEDGQTVFCDRYSDSTLAYQGYGRGLNLELIEELNRLVTNNFLPDLTILLDLPVPVGLARASERNKNLGTVISEGRFDSESIKFHERVRKGYLKIAADNPARIKIINANQTEERVFEDCLHILQSVDTEEF